MLLDRLLATFTDPPAAVRPGAGVHHLHRETLVRASIGETFAFFADATNLNLLTPPWLRFRITTPLPVIMREGLELDYTISLYGMPLSWRSRIDVWDPGARFVDRQIVGPYRWWHHEHRFEPFAGGTRVIDHVEYAPRAPWLSTPLVRRDVTRIFRYRQEALGRLFGPDVQKRQATPPRIGMDNITTSRSAASANRDSAKRSR